MASVDFVRHVRTARSVAYRYLQPGSSAPRAGEEWERLRAAAPLWLASGTVAEFDLSEFGAIPGDRRAELADCVASYRNAVANIEGRPPTDEEMNVGLKTLARMIDLLGEALEDPEGLSLLAALLRESGPLPPFVLGFDYNLDTDWSGDPAVWIWVLLADDVDPDSREFTEFTSRFNRTGWKLVKATGSNRLPYLGYRPVSIALNPFSEDAA